MSFNELKNPNEKFCDSCEYLAFYPDPDSYDLFRDDDQMAYCQMAYCNLAKRTIRGGLEHNELKDISIPPFCPILFKKNEELFWKNKIPWILAVLEDSKQKSLEEENQEWLKQNIQKLKICVCVEDCVVNIFDIAEAWDKVGTILIQNGESVKFKDDFHPGKEALLLVKSEGEYYQYLVFLYSPKE